MENTTQRFPWPRKSEEGVELGVDVNKRRGEIVKLVHRFFHVPGVSMEELLQEVYATILYKNTTRSAHNPQKSSFGHYVYMVANNVCIQFVNRAKKHNCSSLDVNDSDDEKPSIIEVFSEENFELKNDVEDSMDEYEKRLESMGRNDLADYLKIVRTGAARDQVKPTLSQIHKKEFGKKDIKRMRLELKTIVENESVVRSIHTDEKHPWIKVHTFCCKLCRTKTTHRTSTKDMVDTCVSCRSQISKSVQSQYQLSARSG